jgi:hypothetical protein
MSNRFELKTQLQHEIESDIVSEITDIVRDKCYQFHNFSEFFSRFEGFNPRIIIMNSSDSVANSQVSSKLTGFIKKVGCLDLHLKFESCLEGNEKDYEKCQNEQEKALACIVNNITNK